MGTKEPELYLISVAAELLEMHPQTLRKYERLGLVRPLRTLGSMRVYSPRELDRLRLIKAMVGEAGINLAGVERLLSVADVARRIRPLVNASRHSGLRELRRLEGEVDELCKLVGLDRLEEDA